MSFCIFENSLPVKWPCIHWEHSNAVSKSSLRALFAKEECTDCIKPFVNAKFFIRSVLSSLGLYKTLDDMMWCLQRRSHSRFVERTCEHMFATHVHRAVNTALERAVIMIVIQCIFMLILSDAQGKEYSRRLTTRGGRDE